MGLYDREYLRIGPRARSGLGSLRMVSFNTWLIVINVAVFLLSNILLQNVKVELHWGTFLMPGYSVADLQGRQPDRSHWYVDPSSQGVFFHPYYAPARNDPRRAVILNGRPLVEPPQIIGGERFTRRPIIEALGHFSTGKAINDLQVWRFITFQFLHVDAIHLLFNMLGLWFVGGLVEQYLGSKRYAAFYLLCGIFGAVSYLVLNLTGWITQQVDPGLIGVVPAVLFGDIYTPLVGASAGVFGVLLAAAFIAPEAIVDVLLIFPMKLRTAVYLFLGLAVLNLVMGGRNAGGDAAHVGGALAGAYLIRRTHLLRDFFDIFGLSGAPPSAAPREPGPTPRERAELDRILDKVRATGPSSLDDRELATLRRINSKYRRHLA